MTMPKKIQNKITPWLSQESKDLMALNITYNLRATRLGLKEFNVP